MDSLGCLISIKSSCFFIVQINWLEKRYLLSEQVLGTCLGMREITLHQDSILLSVHVCGGERGKGVGVRIGKEKEREIKESRCAQKDTAVNICTHT